MIEAARPFLVTERVREQKKPSKVRLTEGGRIRGHVEVGLRNSVMVLGRARVVRKMEAEDAVLQRFVEGRRVVGIDDA